ncbi:hypothetical protein BV25DRAFT_1891171 [Artomyces pyxidatus]|uniref:Uncharacterized protein n=1 Tax=Artomyces pyxidatus TaxID=48021 RepID=A0ACB8SQP0_9AGAM|nr:hypothetical protein BV25DRAFT_1891171 [Artomyces pyxidatus]
MKLDELNFSGTYAASAEYDLAGNPCLTIDGFGIVGLPLSSDASLRRSVCDCVSFETSDWEHTSIDTATQDAWEVAAEHVQFGNPAWKKWIEETVIHKLSSNLIGDEHFQIRGIDKMLLLGLVHGATTDFKEVFARLLILLPSEFRCPHLFWPPAPNIQLLSQEHIQHHGSSVVYWGCARNSTYPQRISSDRLALSYSLVCPGPSSLVALPQIDQPQQALKEILRNWLRAAASGTGPSKLAYPLEHKYERCTRNTPSFQRMKGADVFTIQILRQACEQVGFRISLASLEYRKKGTAVDSGPDRTYDSWGEPRDASVDEDEEYEMDHVFATGCKIRLIRVQTRAACRLTHRTL